VLSGVGAVGLPDCASTAARVRRHGTQSPNWQSPPRLRQPLDDSRQLSQSLGSGRPCPMIPSRTPLSGRPYRSRHGRPRSLAELDAVFDLRADCDPRPVDHLRSRRRPVYSRTSASRGHRRSAGNKAVEASAAGFRLSAPHSRPSGLSAACAGSTARRAIEPSLVRKNWLGLPYPGVNRRSPRVPVLAIRPYEL
jgi:hypothetical protein